MDGKKVAPSSHLTVGALLTLYLWGILVMIPKPQEGGAFVYVVAFAWCIASWYTAWSAMAWFESFSNRAQEIAALQEELGRLRADNKEMTERWRDLGIRWNTEHGARRHLEVAAFNAAQILRAATRFKSKEAQEARELLEAALLKTLDPDSVLIQDMKRVDEVRS